MPRFFYKNQTDGRTPPPISFPALPNLLASGNRCSDLAHLSRHAVIHLGTSFTLPVMPRFFYKNQTAGRTPPPISFPALPNLLVCPVTTLRTFLCLSAPWDHRDFLFVNPFSHNSLVACRLNYWLVKAIAAVDSSVSVIRAHDVRKFAISLNWACRGRPSSYSSTWILGLSPSISHYIFTVD